MLQNPKPKTFMTYNIYSFIYVENNWISVNLNLHHFRNVYNDKISIFPSQKYFFINL